MRSLPGVSLALIVAVIAVGVPSHAQAAAISVEFDNRSISAGPGGTPVPPGSSLFDASVTSSSGTATAFQNTLLSPDQISGSGGVDTTSLTDDWAYGQSLFYVGFSVDAPTAYTFSGSIATYVYAYQGGT